MHKIWGTTVGKVWGWHRQTPLLYSGCFDKHSVAVGSYTGLHTLFTRLSSVVSHSSFSDITGVSLVFSPLSTIPIKTITKYIN
jgi:hypothetical protein